MRSELLKKKNPQTVTWKAEIGRQRLEIHARSRWLAAFFLFFFFHMK